MRKIEGYVSVANTSGSSSTKPSAKPDQLPDKMYAMCKELCKDISESVLHGINEHFDAFETKFQSLLSVQVDLQNRVANQEQAVCVLDTRVRGLEVQYLELTKNKTVSFKLKFWIWKLTTAGAILRLSA